MLEEDEDPGAGPVKIKKGKHKERVAGLVHSNISTFFLYTKTAALLLSGYTFTEGNEEKIEGVAPLITDPSPPSSTTLSILFIFI